MFCCFSARAVRIEDFERPPRPVPPEEISIKTQAVTAQITQRQQLNDIRIVEAKQSTVPRKKIQERIVSIHEKELVVEKGSEKVRAFLRDEYFRRKSLLRREKVWIAESGKDVVGFIMGIHDYWDIPLNERGGFPGPISNKYRINYLAVDNEHQGKDIGTKLMLHAMRAAKNMGYEYLCVEYLVDGKDISDISSLRRQKFYEQNFSDRFGIISGKEERDSYDEKGCLHRYLCYNLESFDEEKTSR